MKKKLLSWILVAAMVLGMIPANAMVVHATEIPEGAPFCAITTDAGEVTWIEEMGTVEYSYYGETPYYHVTIPANATEVYVTHPFEENPFADASYGSAYGYYADTESWDGSYLSYDTFEEVADGYKITFPLTASTYDGTELCFVADETGYVSHALAVERSDDFTPIAFFSFEFAEDAGEATPEITPEITPETTPEIIETPAVPEEPERSFVAIKTGNQQIAEESIEYKGIFKMGDAPEGDDDGYVYIHEVPYYIVEVPLGTENVDIVYTEGTTMLTSGNDAYGYRTSIDESVDAVSSATVKGTTFKNAYVKNEDGTQTVTTSAKNNSINYEGIRWAVAVEEGDSPFAAVTLFSFDYPEHEHDYNTVVTPPTCEKDGYTTYTCSKCFINYEDSKVTSGGHNYESVTTPPTCTADGYTIYTCSACGDSYQDDVVPKNGHTPDESIEPVVKDPTCMVDGSITYTCFTCGETYEELIEASGHEMKETTVPATCTTQGYILHECIKGDYSFKDNYTELAEHSYVSGECSVCGAPELVDGFYQISTEAHLRWFEVFVEAGGRTGKAKLVNDITIHTDGEAWDGIGTSTTTFAGVFDGNHKTVTIENGNNGLFAYVYGSSSARAEIKNVTVEGTIKNTEQKIGGIAGSVRFANITNCVNNADISGGNYTGGIVGYGHYGAPNGSDSTITNCGNNGNIEGSKYVAGIMSHVYGPTEINGCYNTGEVRGSSYVGGIAGHIQGYPKNCSITNCYNTGKISGGASTGGLCGNMNNGVTMTNCYNTGESEYAIAGTIYNNTAIIRNTYYLAVASNRAVPVKYSNGTGKDIDPAACAVEPKTSQELSSPEFAEILGSSYQTSCPSPVFITQTTVEHTLKDGVCEICKFGSSEKATYNVTFPSNPIGYVVTGEETAAQGEAYTFFVGIAAGYRRGEHFEVSATGHEVLDNGDGSYTVAAVASNMEITVEGVEVAEYTVTLPKTGNGYVVAAVSGNYSPVQEGNSFSFTVEIKENFRAGSEFVVKANDVLLKEKNGMYTIENVTEAQNVTVEGVEMVPFEETVSVSLTISQGTDRFFVSEMTDEIMLLQEMEVPYFDLELYGLEKFYYNPYCYMDKDGNIVRQSPGNKETAYGVVTAMHAFIYATEIFYLDYDVEEAGQGISYETEIEIINDEGEVEVVNQFEHAISWTQDAGSSFMNLWNFGTNLNYYVNYTYPLGKPGWGSTSDQIVLKDGDCISGHLIVADKGSASGSNFPFFVVNDDNGVFDITEQDYKTTVEILDTVDVVTVERGEEVDVTLYLANPGEGYTTKYTKQAGKRLYQIEEKNLISLVVAEEEEEIGWDLTDYVTDENGVVSIDTGKFEAGTYYLGAAGGLTAGGEDLGDGFITTGGETGVAVLKLVITDNGSIPTPTETEAPQPTETEAPQPTETEAPQPTETEAPQPTETETPQPTETEAPQPTETEAPIPEVTPEGPTDDRFDVPTEKYTVTAGSSYNGPEYAIDGNAGSHWEVQWDIGLTNPELFWYQIELDEATELDAVRYLPRWGAAEGDQNGFIEGYYVEVSMDGETWTKVSEGTWEMTEGWKVAEFTEPVTATYVRLYAPDTWSDIDAEKGENSNLSIAEIRVRTTEPTVEITPVPTEEPTPEPTETEAPQPTETEAPQPTETEAPQPTETEAPQPTETEAPQPTETEAPQPTETEAPQPTETPGVKEDVTTVFDDVFEDWYTDYVQYVYDNGLMTGIKGTKHFAPNANITKAQVAQVLFNMEGQPEVKDANVFDELGDVYEAEWYAAAVAWAYDTGVVTGDLTTKKFNPNADVTREQLALMMFRYAQFKEYDTSATTDFAGLVNADKVANWSMDGVKWAVGAGLISGIEKDGVKDLAPQGNASRAQMAAILQRFYENTAK